MMEEDNMETMIKSETQAPMVQETSRPASADNSAEPSHGIEAIKVNTWFGAKHILKDISMKMKPRQVTAIIGPSGCGKSTFIRCLNRMHEVVPGARMQGQILLDGANILELDPSFCAGGSGWSSKKPNPFPP